MILYVHSYPYTLLMFYTYVAMCIYIYVIYRYMHIPNSSYCWVSISGSGRDALFLAENPGTLEPAVGLQSWLNV